MSAADKFTKTVALRDELGNVQTFGPPLTRGDLPDWAKSQVTNPALFESDDDMSGSGGGGDDDAPPPKAGKGSGEDKWRDYAERKGLDVSDLESRDAIIDALEAEGIRTE